MIKLKKFLYIYTYHFVIALLFVVIYTHLILDLELEQRVGNGIFYLKGYYTIYEEFGGEMRRGYTEQTGIGVVTIPLIISLFTTAIYLIIKKLMPKRAKSK
ncbi:hypothetical protein QA612_20355 [Evansella sp. AB-P1]|uniref:hypothetical protein n=1 Tax=Evansella sp. AB-P1 TaxID=3037653 RepID=UPI00241FC34E|nr:hypothetical protein [Evansella sp. AB-P1]MDG5789813.1 hypothetical protein [Evansella sp. AB-P1]